MKRVLFLTLILLYGFSSICYSLEPETHRRLNEYIGDSTINGFSLDLYIKEQLGFPDGGEEMFDGKEVFKWLNDGGEEEDEPPLARSSRHFHNPLVETWDEAGLWGTFESSVIWGQRTDQRPRGHNS